MLMILKCYKITFLRSHDNGKITAFHSTDSCFIVL